MADSIPRAYLKEITDALAAEPLYVAFFKSDMTGYDAVGASALYSALGNEVSNSGTGYTTGGYALGSKVSETIGTDCAVRLVSAATVITGATFTARFAVYYNHTTGKIRGVKDFGADKVITSGTITFTWSTTNGNIKISF